LWHPTRNAEKVARSEKTKSRPRNPQPTVDGSRRGGSAGLAPLFSSVFRIRALDPALGPLPAHSQPRKRSSDGLPAYALVRKPLLEAHLCGVLERPKAALSAKFPRRAVQQLPQSARTLLVEGGVDLSGTRGTCFLRASSPRSLKSWMASRTVCCPHPRFLAICGARSPRALARSIWQRRSTKASEERRPSSSASCSSSESVRTKMGGLMFITVTHNPKPVLDVH
jgi:hypothetical protein